MRLQGGTWRERTDIQRAAMLFGVVFLVVGVAGFIPGITTDYARLDVFDDVGAKLLGVFGINILENIAHLLFGVLGLGAASSWGASRSYFLGVGVIYLALWLYGLIIDEHGSSANFLGMNDAAHWLHFILGVVMVAIGFLLGRRAVTDRPVTA